MNDIQKLLANTATVDTAVKLLKASYPKSGNNIPVPIELIEVIEKNIAAINNTLSQGIATLQETTTTLDSILNDHEDRLTALEA
jgi:hypothetical protein